METKEFNYNGSVVEFELDNKNVMVNATQMAKVFCKEAHEYVSMKSTQELVLAFCQTGNLRFENEFSADGRLIKVVRGGRNNGTWMDRRIAIAFAMWLNPLFAVWVCNTIDELLFGSYIEDEKCLKEIARIQTEITGKEEQLKDNPIIREINDLKVQEQKEKRKLELRKKSRISNFRTIFSAGEMSGGSN